MKIAVIGTGYVGLVTGTCFAETGNEVTCVDIDQRKVDMLNNGQITIYEPGLEKIFLRNLKEDRLKFTSDLQSGIEGAQILFLALPTPPGEDGSADLKYVLGVAKSLGKLIKDYVVVDLTPFFLQECINGTKCVWNRYTWCFMGVLFPISSHPR